MRLYDEIFKGVDGVALSRCVIVPRGGGYFEGVQAVGDFSPDRIVLYFVKEWAEIVGEGLSIAKYFEGDLQVSGKIYSVRIDEKGKEIPNSTAQIFPEKIEESSAYAVGQSKTR